MAYSAEWLVEVFKVQIYFFNSQQGTNFINPFLPTGQFFAPKLIILIKYLTDILFFSVV